jgi:F-type H+-transporting ATPase subunit delta
MINEIAERYGQGLFALCIENGTVTEKKDQAEQLLSIMDGEPDLKLFFRAVKITKQEKRDLVDNTLSSFLDADMVRFMKLLIDKGRINSLTEILEEYVRLANEHLGIEKAIVWSARALGEEDLERIRKALIKKTGKDIVVENRIDKRLIAGIKVTVGNNVTDITMKKKIDTMRELLLEGGRA